MTADADSSLERTVAFVDLAGFTALTETHGDEDAAELAERFADLARAALLPGERVVKTIGDAVMLDAPDPATGVQLIGRICAATDAETTFPIVRAGIHHGRVIRRGDDLFGATVNVASRVTAHAGGGQVLATAAVADTAGVAVHSIGTVTFRNMAEPFELFELDPCPSPHARVVDPVCRMALNLEDASGRLTHDDHEHWFCSLACVSAFAADPDRYTRDDARSS